MQYCRLTEDVWTLKQSIIILWNKTGLQTLKLTGSVTQRSGNNF